MSHSVDVKDRCYCILEGGGAKGIAHVGALSALEKAGLDLVGFAGTSAGAIVAALAAAGYKAEELFGTGGSVLDVIDCDRTNIYGGAVFRPYRSPKKLLGLPAWLSIRVTGHLRAIWFLPAVLLLTIASGVFHWFGWLGEGGQFIIQLGIILTLVTFPVYLACPVATLEDFAKAINQAINLKLYDDRRTSKVTFEDMDALKCSPLKIVAADITHRKLVLFSAQTTPKVAVADAVAASACIPGIFRPYRIDKSLHYDGGIVSNLPAWAFDSERALDRDAWTAVVEVSDKKDEDTTPRGYGVLKAALETALFGSGLLNTRSVDRLRTVRIRVGLDLLEFGLSREKAREVVNTAEEVTRAQLVLQLQAMPRQIRAALDLIVSDARDLISVSLPKSTSGRRRRFRGKLRAGLHFPPRGDTKSLLNEFSVGQEDHTDEYIRLPLDDSFVGAALAEKEALYVDRSTSSAFWQSSLAKPEHRWTRKMVWRDLQWCLCVPYFHVPSGAWLVLTLDSDQPLGLRQTAVTLDSIAAQSVSILEQNLPLEAFRWL